MGTEDRILVAVATRGRPDSLITCLQSLAKQAPSAQAIVEVLVIDNNDQPMTDRLPSGVRIVHEPCIGIPFARNSAVENARSGGYDYLAFIDDDEIATESWLSRLLATARSRDADVATGPVQPVLPAGTRRFVAKHPFMRRNRTFPDGAQISDAYTNNVVVSRRTFMREDFVFDPRMRFSGGSDKELFGRLARTGVRIIWVDNALVIEPVPEARASVSWILRRSWRLGVNRVQRLRMWQPSRWRAGLLYAGAAGELTAGALGLTLWIVRPSLGLRALGRCARALGTIGAGALNADAREYAES